MLWAVDWTGLDGSPKTVVLYSAADTVGVFV
jgi:hypothetical protein